MIIAVDFDGTCTTHEYPLVGRDIGAEPVLRKLVAAGHQLILWTMRSGKELEEAVGWFQEREIPLFGVNGNPTQKSWTSSAKPYAQLYIDDAALGCPLCKPQFPGESHYVDWETVEQMLLPLIAGTDREVAGETTNDGIGQLHDSDQVQVVQPQSLLVKTLACMGFHV